MHCFHTPYFVIINDIWGVHVSSHGQLSSAPVLQTWQPSQLCIQSLSVLVNLEPLRKSEVYQHPSAYVRWSSSSEAVTGFLKLSLTRIVNASPNRVDKHLRSVPLWKLKVSCVSKTQTRWPERSHLSKAVTRFRVSSTNKWSIISILCNECGPIGGTMELHFGKGLVRIKERLLTSKHPTKW